MTTPPTLAAASVTFRTLVETYIESPEATLAALKGDPRLQYEELYFNCSPSHMLTLVEHAFPDYDISYTKPKRGDYIITLSRPVSQSDGNLYQAWLFIHVLVRVVRLVVRPLKFPSLPETD